MGVKRIISVLLMIIMILAMSTTVFAVAGIQPEGGNELAGIGNKVLGYVQWFGMAISMGMLIYVGIKYTMAPANEKANLKSASIKYIIGAIIIFSVTGLFGILQSISNEIVAGGGGTSSGTTNPAGGQIDMWRLGRYLCS